MDAKYDLVVIGGGNAGYTPAIRASQLGMRVALVELSKLGGNCLHRGCIPTKAMLRAASVLADLRRHGEELGVLADGVRFDYARAASHRDRVVEQLHRGTQGLMRKNGITVYEGVGSFAGPKKVAVEGTDGMVTSDDVLRTDHRPASVIILGSGAVGVEFASMYDDFGTEVTIVEVLDRIVPLEDPEISKVLKKEFEGRGIRVLTSTKADPESLEKTQEGVRMKVLTASGEETLQAELLLVAVGRKTVTEKLNVGVTKVETNGRGEILVDEFYRTAEPGVYAAGDVIGGYRLAHVANHEGTFAKLVEGTPQEIGMSVHAHPTLAEAFGEAAMDVYGRAINF